MNRYAKILLTALLITLCGVVLVGLYWISYYGITLLIERLIYIENPQDLRQDSIRNSSVLVIGVITILVMRTNLKDIPKAILMLGALTILLMAIVLRFYEMMVLALVLVVIVCGIIVLMIIKQRKPWFYYYAVGLSIVMALLYAWPR